MPQRFWWQGISEERFESAAALFLRSGTFGAGSELVPLSEFRDTYAAAYAAHGTSEQNLGLLANALNGFTPFTRPVFCRLLETWTRLYTAYDNVSKREVSDLIGLTETLCAGVIGEEVPSPPNGSLFESPLATSQAVSVFIRCFIIPRIEALLAIPEEDTTR